MDTEEAQECSREIAAKATEKELRKQRYVQYQQQRQQTTGYDFPRPGLIPGPQLEKPNFGTPNYEEITMYGKRPHSRSRSL